MTIVQRMSRRPAQMLADIEAAFPGARIVILPEDERARHRSHVRLSLGHLQIDRFETVGSELAAVSADRFHLGFLTRGEAELRTGSGHVHMQPFHNGVSIPPESRFTLGTTPGALSYTLELPAEVLRRHWEELVGRPPAVDSCQVAVDLDRGPGRACVRNIVGAFNELRTLAGEGLSALAITSFGELLTNLAITAANSQLHATQPAVSAAASPNTVRRARDHLQARAHEPVTISGLASELGLSTRALQLGFKKHLHCSPMQFLVRCRLDLARARLLSPSPGDTVSAIAMASGFVNLGKFSMRYRSCFGETPSTTLARARLPF